MDYYNKEVMNMDEKNIEKTEGKVEAETATTPAEETGIEKTTSALDRADEIVDRRNRVCDREEKILERKEAMAAREAVGGETEAGTESKPEFSDAEKAARKRVGDIGRASGASWAKDYE